MGPSIWSSHRAFATGKGGVAGAVLVADEEGGSVMPKSSSQKVTSQKVATKASKALGDGRSSGRTGSIAGSALAQAEAKKGGK